MTALSIVLPCLNEADRLRSAVEPLLAALDADPGRTEILIVDDGSADDTLAVAQALSAEDPRVGYLHWPDNRGKGYAVRAGMLAARGERIVFTDADGAYGPAEIARVAAALERSPVAIGSRNAAGSSAAPPRRLASVIFNAVLRRLVGLDHRDTQCGLKGFRREAAISVFSRCEVNRFAFDVEALVVAKQLGYEVAEVPVTATERSGSTVRLLADSRVMLRDILAVRRRTAARRAGAPRRAIK